MSGNFLSSKMTVVLLPEPRQSEIRLTDQLPSSFCSHLGHLGVKHTLSKSSLQMSAGPSQYFSLSMNIRA